MKLLPLYTAIASAANWTVTSDGFISKKITGKSDTEPVLVKGKRLAMPTKEQLQNPEVVRFHPLKEDVLNPDTDVIDILRKSLNARLNITTCWLAAHLLVLAMSPDEQAKMNPEQSEFLSKVKKVDESTVEDMKKILASMKVDAKTKTAVSIFTKKGGMLDGKKYTCVGVVKFALYDELKETLTKETKPEVFGVKLASKKNRDAILATLEYIYPQIQTPAFYNYGSNSQIAAFMDALMQTVGRLAACTNQVVDLFGNLLDGLAEEMHINGEWMPIFQDLGSIHNEIRMIPHQTQNVEEAAPVAPQTPQQAKAIGVPYVAPQAPKIHTDKGLDFAALLAANTQQARSQQAGFGFGNQPVQQNRFGQQPVQQNNNPILSALTPNAGFGQQQQTQSHPFAEFQTGNQGGRGGFNNAPTTGGFGFGRARGGGFGGNPGF